jgi:hypothetical protein
MVAVGGNNTVVFSAESLQGQKYHPENVSWVRDQIYLFSIPWTLITAGEHTYDKRCFGKDITERRFIYFSAY